MPEITLQFIMRRWFSNAPMQVGWQWLERLPGLLLADEHSHTCELRFQVVPLCRPGPRERLPELHAHICVTCLAQPLLFGLC